MGIDPSINCTGVCVSLNDEYIYNIIPSKMTKKMSNFKHPRINILSYNKLEMNDLEYSDKEYNKVQNLVQICNKLEEIIDKFSVQLVCMEGVSYGSVGSAALVDLAGLNFMIRYMLSKKGIKFIIVSPTSLKKFAVANGSATKDLMVYAWHELDQEMKTIKDIKVDDLADAYFLMQYALNKYEI